MLRLLFPRATANRVLLRTDAMRWNTWSLEYALQLVLALFAMMVGFFLDMVVDKYYYSTAFLDLAVCSIFMGGVIGYFVTRWRRRKAMTSVYVYDAFGQLAAEYSTAAAQNADCATCYLSHDHLGSVRLVTDQNGSVVSRHDYLPFGEEIPSGWAGRGAQFGAADGTRQRFTGMERYGENTPAMDFFQARYFSGVLGRFNSPDPGNAGADPTDPQSWNGYSYVGNNPLNAVDRSGMSLSEPGDPWDCWDPWFCGWFPIIPIVMISEGGGGGGSGNTNQPPAPAQPPPPPPASPIPPGSFPGGETLGLPPGLKIPAPWAWEFDPFILSVCSAADANCADPRFWNFYISSRAREWGYALTVLVDFLTGGGATNRTYYTNDAVSQSLMNSRGFQSALRRACASGKGSGPFSVGTYEAARNIPYDSMYSPTGIQVGGYLGNYSFKGSSMQISISNDAGAHSFFEHAAPNSPFSSGPLRTINQRFDLNIPNACGT